MLLPQDSLLSDILQCFVTDILKGEGNVRDKRGVVMVIGGGLMKVVM